MQAHKEIEIEPIVPQERLSANCKPPTILLVMREQLDSGAISQFLQQLRIASLSAVFSAIYCRVRSSMIFDLSSFSVLLLSVELPELLLQRIMQLMATKEDNVSSLLEISQVSTDQDKQYGKL